MRRATHRATGQGEINFFDVPAAPGSAGGSLDIRVQLREVLGDVLARAKVKGKDRFAVAADISRLTGREMTKNMLDRYAALDEEKRFPLECLPALVQSTGDFELLELLAAKCGCKVLRGEEAWITEVGATVLLERKCKSRRDALHRAVPEAVLDRLAEAVLERIKGEQ